MNPGAGTSVGHPLAVILLDDPAPARADERDTLVQADTVEGALVSLGYRCRRVHLSPSIATAAEELLRLGPSLVFNLVESIGGVGGRLHLAPALVESLGLRVSGAGSVAMAVSTDKILAKRILRGSGISTPDWRSRTPSPDGRRWIVKPVDEDASVGIGPENVSADTAALARLAGERQRTLGGRWFFERYVEGREFNVSLLEEHGAFKALPVAEIRFDAFEPGAPRIVDFAAKWEPEAWSYANTARRFDQDSRDTATLSSIATLALRSVSVLGLRGYARVDVRLDSAGRAWVLEVNANPCLSPDAGFAAAAERAGLTIEEVVARIVRSTGAPVPSLAAA